MSIKKTLNALKFAGLVGLLSLIPTKAKGQNLNLADFQTTVSQPNELIYYVGKPEPEIPKPAELIPNSEIPSPILDRPYSATNPIEYTNFPDLQTAIDATSLTTTKNKRFLIYNRNNSFGGGSIKTYPSKTIYVGMNGKSSLVRDKYEKKIDIPTTRTELNSHIYLKNKEDISFVNLYLDGDILNARISWIEYSKNINFFNCVFKGRKKDELPDEGIGIDFSENVNLENNVFTDFYRILDPNWITGDVIKITTNLDPRFKVRLRRNIIVSSYRAIYATDSPSADLGSATDNGKNVFINNIDSNLRLVKSAGTNYDTFAQGNTWFNTLEGKGLLSKIYGKPAMTPEEIDALIQSQTLEEVPLQTLEQILQTISSPDFVVPTSKLSEPYSEKFLEAIQSNLYIVPYNKIDPLHRIGLIPNATKWWRRYE